MIERAAFWSLARVVLGTVGSGARSSSMGEKLASNAAEPGCPPPIKYV
jgi:hypothetical protein